MESLKEELLIRPASLSPRGAGQPLVSIMSFCKDRASIIRRSIDSVLSQSYPNFEFLVQDGASTDGTLEILKSYQDPRIKIVSQKDSGVAEAFWRALNRCQGEIIGTCLSDEELLPGAIEKAVEFFRENPEVGAMTCDGHVTDMQGNVIDEFNAGEFSLVDYLFGWYSPFWPGSFFRRQALVDVGLNWHKWTPECLEFEIWCRLGTQHAVKYVPVRMSKYAVHDKQLSQTREAYHEHFDNRALVIQKMFSKDGFFGENAILLKGCLYNQLYLLYNHVRAYQLVDQMNLLAGRLHQLLGEVSLAERVQYFEYFSARQGTGLYEKVSNVWLRVALAIPASVRRRIPRAVKRTLRSGLTLGMFFMMHTEFALKMMLESVKARVRPSKGGVDLITPYLSPRLYDDAAQIYYARGQIDEALRLWQRAEALKDPLIDGLACQARLMSPTATYRELLSAQKQWAQHYAQPNPSLSKARWKPYDGRRRVRIGYYCSFMDSDTIRFIMLPVIRNRDPERFEVFAYSPSPITSDIAAGFDQVRVTRVLSDRKFVEQVRADEIDIFVELSGFSPQNRFSAMASRCAPVQVSYLNHTGTSAVPNVDYVLADEVSVPPEHEEFFTEQVWRLPGCFLSYSYDLNRVPPVAPPPSLKRGHVTFGCLGSGGKVNTGVIDLWARLMHRVPGSRFLIRNLQLSTPNNRAFMESRFRRFGIDPARLTILNGADRDTILKCYDEIDISLDTSPYCGGNTIAEPLWQGVPVVTLKGSRFSSRYGASLVMAAGCPELVADTEDEYIEIAARLAQSPERLEHYRRNLRAMAKQHGLSDAGAFARKLEAAYIEMLQRAQRRPG